MLKVIWIVISILCLNTISAQRIERYIEKLSHSGVDNSARVDVIMHNVGNRVRALEKSRSSHKIGGYRVRIFLDNSQNARARANEFVGRFKSIFPDVPTYLTYETPYFKVSVGNCTSIEEAIILWGRVKENFDKAFVTRESIAISSIKE